MQDYFDALGEVLFGKLQDDEQLLLDFYGEDSDFVRMNHNRIRQAGAVAQRQMSLDLIEGQRHAQASVELSGDKEQDIDMLTGTLAALREQREFLPEDPYLNYATSVNSTEYHHDKAVIDSRAAIEEIVQVAGDMDLVGLFANGMQYAGFANSMGQRNWHSSASFNFDWSVYLQKDKAVKSNYAGFDWDSDKLTAKIDSIKQQLDVMAKPAMTLEPGAYRAYLAPSALAEIMAMMCWGGFGLKSHRTKSTPLLQMVEQGRKLADTVSLREHNARGLAPLFTSSGFIKPDAVQLIENGAYRDCLVGPRSAIEYDRVTNTGWEYPGSLELAAGTLDNEQVLAELDTGLYINNLWYLNFSDRNACQLTGMTRFACFWVEQGEIRAPVNVMRFDDSVYKLLGDNMLGLTAERDMLLDPSTYGQRSDNSMLLPGLLVSDLRLTL